MIESFPRLLGPWIIQAHVRQLRGIAGRLPPPTEMRLLSVLNRARYEIVWINRGSGPFDFNEQDFERVAEALDLR